jgi:hypothetical protein
MAASGEADRVIGGAYAHVAISKALMWINRASAGTRCAGSESAEK